MDDTTISPGVPEALIEAARAVAVKKLDWNLGCASLLREHLDFSVPNQPLKKEVEQIYKHLTDAAEAMRVLAELAPWLYEDDEGDNGDPAPEPDPAGTEAA